MFCFSWSLCMYFCNSRFLTSLIFALNDWCESKIAWETPSSIERRIIVLDMSKIFVMHFPSCRWSNCCKEVFSGTGRSGWLKLDVMPITLVWFSTNVSTGGSTPLNVSSVCLSKSICRSSDGSLGKSTCFYAFFFGTCLVTPLWLDLSLLSLISDFVFANFFFGAPFSCIRSDNPFVNGRVKGTNAYARSCMSNVLPSDDAAFVSSPRFCRFHGTYREYVVVYP